MKKPGIKFTRESKMLWNSVNIVKKKKKEIKNLQWWTQPLYHWGNFKTIHTQGVSMSSLSPFWKHKWKEQKVVQHPGPFGAFLFCEGCM